MLIKNVYRFLVLGVWDGKSGWMGWRLLNSPTFSRYVLLLREKYYYFNTGKKTQNLLFIITFSLHATFFRGTSWSHFIEINKKPLWVVLYYTIYFHDLISLSLQAGSLQLSPVSVEITYGLERILMLLQVCCLIFFWVNPQVGPPKSYSSLHQFSPSEI